MRSFLMLALLAGAAGCLRETQFKCATDTDCSASGAVCESTGFCAFTDMDCASGRRYGDFSGSFSNQCVGDGVTDAGVDAPKDTGAGNCPAGYAALQGAGTHVYKVTTNAAIWATQRDRCAADGAYLAIPDNVAELQAITMAAAARSWVGIDDQVTEGSYKTVKGTDATFLPWDTGNGEPNNAGEQDCVSALTTSLIATDKCSLMFPAVCECEP